MHCTVAIPPYAEPISLAELKNHLRVEASVTDDDVLIQSIAQGARDVIETATGANANRHRVMMATTFELTRLSFPSCGYLDLPRVPVVSVTSITYIDSAGTSQTLATTGYAVLENRIYLAYGQSWPSLRGSDEDRITIKFIAGTMATFTAVASTDIFTVLGRSFAVGDRVRLLNSGGALPTGLAVNTDYFVIAGPKLSLTLGGAAVDIVSAGSGTHYIGIDVAGFETLKAAIKLMAGHLYEHREAVNVGNIVTPFPMAVDALVGSQHA